MIITIIIIPIINTETLASLVQQTLSQSYGSLMNKCIQLKDNSIDSSVTSVRT